MFLLFTTLVSAAPILEVSDTCPGLVDIWVSDATPDTMLYFLSAPVEDSMPLGGSPCRGTLLPLGRPTQVLTHGRTDEDGRQHLRPRVASPDCGLFLSVIETGTCDTSEAVQLGTPLPHYSADFDAMGDGPTEEIVSDGLLVSAEVDGLAADLFLLELNGLGVSGGSHDRDVDPGETVIFTFDPPGRAIQIHHATLTDTDGDGILGGVLVEATDALGATLGPYPASLLDLHEDVTTFLRTDALQTLRLTADGDSFRIRSLDHYVLE